MSKQIALAILLALGAANLGMMDTAWAETPEERQACTNDANNLCPDEIPDREKVYQCLVKKVNDLSPACKRIIASSIAPAPKGKR